MDLRMRVNDKAVHLAVEPRDSLLEVLRDRLSLRGAHAACEQGACGACTVLVDGRAAQSCLLFAVQAEGSEVRTIESVGTPGSLHPLQEAMHRHHALQCGFCTPGIVMAALDLLESTELFESGQPLDRETIEAAMSGNLCRCTGYHPIVDAIEEVASGRIQSDGRSSTAAAAAGSEHLAEVEG